MEVVSSFRSGITGGKTDVETKAPVEKEELLKKLVYTRKRRSFCMTPGKAGVLHRKLV